jgi:hypothetical protein
MVTMVDVGEVQATLSERNREAMIRGFARFGSTRGVPRELNGRVERCGMDNAAAFLCCNELYVERLPPLSALFVGAETPFGQWEVIDFLAACYPTVGESFRHIGRHFRLINPHVEFVVSDGAAGELPFVEFRHQLSERDEFFDEYTTGIFLAHFRAMSRCPLRLAALHSVRARPVDADVAGAARALPRLRADLRGPPRAYGVCAQRLGGAAGRGQPAAAGRARGPRARAAARGGAGAGLRRAGAGGGRARCCGTASRGSPRWRSGWG